MTETFWLACTDPQRMLDALKMSDLWRSLCPPGGPGTPRKLRLFAAAFWRWHLQSAPDGALAEACDAAEKLAERHWQGGVSEVRSVLSTEPAQGAVAAARRWADQNRPDYGRAALAVQAALLREVLAGGFFGLQLCGRHCRADGCPCCKRLRTHAVTDLALEAYDRSGRKDCPTCQGRRQLLWHAERPPVPVARYAYPQERPEPRPAPVAKTCPACHGTGIATGGRLDAERLAILADALERAGCDNQTLLLHLRGREHKPCVSGGEIKATVEVPLAGWHVRGCWALDCVLGKS